MQNSSAKAVAQKFRKTREYVSIVAAFFLPCVVPLVAKPVHRQNLATAALAVVTHLKAIPKSSALRTPLAVRASAYCVYSALEALLVCLLTTRSPSGCMRLPAARFLA